MKNHEAQLYLLDFGDFIKIGFSTRLKERIVCLGSDLKEALNFEASLFWPMSRTLAMGLERALLNKYKSFVINHDGSKKEILSADVKDLILKDIADFQKLFDYNFETLKLSERLTGNFKDGILSLAFTKMLKEIPENHYNREGENK